MRCVFLFLLVVLMHAHLVADAQAECCSDPVCRARSQSLAAASIQFLELAGNGSADATENGRALEKLFQNDPVRYSRFRSLIYEIIKFTDEDSHDRCFQTFLSSEQYVNIHRWMAYFNDLRNPTSFPSPEFCEGFRTRLEIGQGAAGFLASDMAYLGTIKGLLSYTFGKKRSCGNRLRALVGPAFFLRDRTAYSTLDTRLAYRISDIMIKNPPVFLGNLNLFGEYVTNFQRFSYAGIGAEAQLGRFGANVSVNRSFAAKHLGFVLGVFIGNRKKK